LALCTIAALAGLIASLEEGRENTSRTAKGEFIGESRLVSIDALPQSDGAMCEWVPASSHATLRAALQEEAASARSAVSSVSPETAARQPLRVIRDPYPSFSSVSVDVERDEVVMTDENLFQILVYDRTANTPPSATMTEPKRMIAGARTEIEFQCGVYVDPKSGDIYAINNDTVDKMVIFSRNARGNVPPDRVLHTPHGTFGMAVDEGRQELFLTIQHTSSVVIYPKMAVNEEPPLRVLHGTATRLADPHGIALDTQNNVFFVSNHGSFKEFINKEITEEGKTTVVPKRNHVLGSGRNLPPSITVHALDAKGNEPPVRVIEGPKTQLNWPSGLAVDPKRDELYVANDSGNAVLVFRASASGDIAPLRTIQGPRSGIKNPTGLFLDTKNDELWVSNFGNHTVTVYKPTASGDAPPLRTIRSGPTGEPALMIGNPGGLAFDTKREEILVPN
jgi:DNA-binding beta-propeller fold protein YncE